MASTPQKTRPKFSIPQDPAFKELFGSTADAIATSAESSAFFVQKFLAISVSSVAFLRAILPKDSFTSRYMGDLHLKIISDGRSATPLAKELIARVRSCFDAIEKRYLKSVCIWFHADRDKADDVLEAYVFNFEYSANQADVTMLQNDKIVTKMRSGDDIKASAVILLKTLLLTVERLDPLPSHVFLEFTITYVKGTPSDYQAPTFRPTSKKPALPNSVSDIGRVTTNHHDLHLQFNELDRSYNRSLADGSTFGTDLLLEEDDINCICGGGEDGKMIQCRCCDRWQHAICYGLFPDHEEFVPKHICVTCAADDQVEGSCLDPSLLRLSATALRRKALFRRTLLVLSEPRVSAFTIAAICHRLHIKESEAKKVIEKMLSMKLIRRSEGGESEQACDVERPALTKFLTGASAKIRQIMENKTGAGSSVKEPEARAKKRKANEECEA